MGYDKIRLLLQKKKFDKVKDLIDKSEKLESGELQQLIYFDKIDFYKYALENGKGSKDPILNTIGAMFYKGKDFAKEMIDYLLDNGYIDINDSLFNGEKSLIQIIANETRDVEIYKYYTEKGVDIDKNHNLVIIMADHNNIEGMKYFVEKGCDINYINNSQYSKKNSIVAEASRYVPSWDDEKDLSSTFKYLVDNGVDLTFKDYWNKDVLLHLSKEKRNKSLKYVFSKTVDQYMDKLDDNNKEEIFKELTKVQQYAPSKKEKEYIVKILAKFPEYSEHFIAQLNDSKVKMRELAINILIEMEDMLMEFGDDKYLLALKNRSKTESNKKILKLINDYLKDKKDIVKKAPKKESKKTEKLKEYSLEWFEDVAEKNLDYPKVSWLNLTQLPDLISKDGKKIDKKVLTYFLTKISYNYILVNKQDRKIALKLIELIDVSSLENIFKSLYQMPSKLKSDDKWIFNIYYLLGENNPEYLKTIDEYAKRFLNISRWAIAGDIISQMIYMDNIAGVKKVDWYSRKMKHKGIKRVANSAISRKASFLKLTTDQFRDTLISDFGLNEDREVVVDYGERSFTLKLMPDYKFQIKDDKGKIFKNLPKPSKNDDAEKGEAAKKFLKDMKKEIKDIIKIQKERLEYLFIVNKLQAFSYWNSVFVKNPVLNIFASNLFWGVYNKEGKLETVFRYNEDKTFTNLDDDEIKLKSQDLIGLVHPIDLTDDQIKKAEEIIEDFEIIQPLKQIGREVFNFEGKKDIKEIKDFDGLKFNPKSMNYKLLKNGWEKGYVVDNGFFEDYNRSVPEVGITANLRFSGVDIQLVYGVDEPATLGKLTFNKGYYSSAIEVSKVDKKVYSEVYRSLYLLSKTKI